MAMFPTHIKCSTLAGIGGGIVANVGYGVPLVTSAVGAGLCCIGGILPDIDSGPGIPLREITTFLASVVPTMLITRLLSYSFTQESLILSGAVIYILIRFGLSHFLRNYTIHRGMFHSFPSMGIFGELTYLLFYGESMFVRIFMVSSVCTGFFIHLLLDEIYSVEWDGKPRLKKSFGTAMKFVGNGLWPNVTCYGKLALLTYLVMNDPNVIHQLYTQKTTDMAKNLGEAVKDRFDSALAQNHSKSSGEVAPMAMFPASPNSGPGSNVGSANGMLGPSNSEAVPTGPAWPAGAAAPASTAAYSPQPVAAPATSNWSVPVDPSANANLPASANQFSTAGPAPGNAAPPAGNRPWPTAPGRQASGTRFWQ